LEQESHKLFPSDVLGRLPYRLSVFLPRLSAVSYSHN
jgi:hypothetical protein